MMVDLKDAIYLIVYIISIISVFQSFKGRLIAIEKRLHEVGGVIYAEKGSLNLIDVRACKEHRDQIFTALRRSETVMELALAKIETLNENVLAIKVHLQIRSDSPKPH